MSRYMTQKLYPRTNFTASNHRPRVIQLFFDQIEVMKIENGQKVYEKLVPDTYKPILVEMLWDGEVVYVLQAEKHTGSSEPRLKVQLDIIHL